MIDSLASGLMLIGRDGLILEANPSARALLESDPIGRPYRVVFGLVDIDPVRECFTTEKSYQQVDVPAGADRIWGMTVSPVARGARSGSTEPRAEPETVEAVIVGFRDITQKQHGLRRITELARIIESSPEYIGIGTFQKELLYTNPAGFRMIGLPANTELGSIPQAIDPFCEHEHLMREWIPIARRKGYCMGETTMRHTGGHHIPVEAVLILNAAETDSGETYTVFARDITDRKLAEHALRESEGRFKGLLDQAADALYLVDEEGHVIDVNKRACDSLGYTRDEMCGLSLEDFAFLPDGASVSLRVLEQLKEGTVMLEGQHRRKDGSLFPVEVSLGSIVISGERQWLAFARDVSDRKRAQETLRESEERFRQVTETIEEVFWMTDAAQTEMLYVSPAYEKIWGRSCESLYASPRDWSKAIHSEDRERVIRASAASRQILGEYDEIYRICRPEGDIRWIRDRGFPIRDGAGNVYRIVGIAEDITVQKMQSVALASAQREATVGRLAAAVAHEVNNPLTAMKTRLTILRERLGAESDSSEDFEVISRQIDRISRTVRNLLGFARFRAVSSTGTSATDLIRNVVELFDGGFRSKGIELLAEIPLKLPALPCDADRIQEVLVNLLENAREALSAGQWVRVSVSRLGEALEILVEDNGPGLGDDPERVFRSYYTTKKTGTGIGLEISRRNCEAHGGTLTGENRPAIEGGGARFRVMLPL